MQRSSKAAMATEKLRITLNNPEKVYSAGETIKGEICLNLTKRTKIRGKCMIIKYYLF